MAGDGNLISFESGAHWPLYTQDFFKTTFFSLNGKPDITDSSLYSSKNNKDVMISLTALYKTLYF